jgi:hypothetical protein
MKIQLHHVKDYVDAFNNPDVTDIWDMDVEAVAGQVSIAQAMDIARQDNSLFDNYGGDYKDQAAFLSASLSSQGVDCPDGDSCPRAFWRWWSNQL